MKVKRKKNTISRLVVVVAQCGIAAISRLIKAIKLWRRQSTSRQRGRRGSNGVCYCILYKLSTFVRNLPHNDNTIRLVVNFSLFITLLLVELNDGAGQRE